MSPGGQHAKRHRDNNSNDDGEGGQRDGRSQPLTDQLIDGHLEIERLAKLPAHHVEQPCAELDDERPIEAERGANRRHLLG
jgi:hypothetical protein